MLKFKNVSASQLNVLMHTSTGPIIGHTRLRYRYDEVPAKLFIQVLSDNVSDHDFRRFVHAVLVNADANQGTVFTAAAEEGDPDPNQPPADPGDDGFSGVDTNGIWR